jgi:hypothetical protein
MTSRTILPRTDISSTTVRLLKQRNAHPVTDSPVDQTLSEHFIIHVPGLDNPFREYVLPLAYQHQGILHALLGLSSCHMYNTGHANNQRLVTVSLGYRLSAIRYLASLLHKEDTSRLTPTEEEYVLAMVLLLVLHDVRHTCLR